MATTALRIAALRRRLRASRVLGATAALLALAALLAVGPADRGVARVHGVARVADVDRVERAATARPAVRFGTPGYYLRVKGDAFFNTVGPGGDILATSDDSRGVNGVCRYSGGGDIVLVRARGSSAQRLQLSTVNCLTDYGPLGGGQPPDGCSWKNGGLTRVGRVLYLAVARQLHACSVGRQVHGLQPSSDASIIRSTDGGHTWTNPWGVTSRNGAAPAWNARLHRYRAMFPGTMFPAPFFIQYGPGDTHAVDGGDRYLYAVSTDGYAYNGNWLHLARVPLHRVQHAAAWQWYHGRVGGAGRSWTRSPAGATRVLQARNGVSQPAIQYVAALHRYLLLTAVFTQWSEAFPTASETARTVWLLYSAPKPWGPWRLVYRHPSRRTLWCAADPCRLVRRPGGTAFRVGTPLDQLGLYDPVLVQKFVATRPLSEQAVLTSGNWEDQLLYPGENLYRLHALPTDLSSLTSLSSAR